MTKSGEKLEKVGKSRDKWGKVGKVGKSFFFNIGQNGRRRPFWMSVIELVRDIWMNNACVKFEERSLNPSKVIVLTTKL